MNSRTSSMRWRTPLLCLATLIAVAMVCTACRPTQAKQKVAPDRIVAHGPIQFGYPASLAREVIAEDAEGVSAEQDGGMGYLLMPDHIAFTFEGSYADGQQLYRQTMNLNTAPQILVFETGAFRTLSPLAAERIAELGELLHERPDDVASEIPVLPIPNGAQMLRAQVEYLEFSQGSGVRFVTQYAQETRHVNNQEVFYTFQGLSDDGRYYVAAYFPITSSVLPASNCAKPDCSDAPQRPEDTDVIGAALALDACSPADFAPDLFVLDAVIRSIKIDAGHAGG
jgi:hypothetical protein